MRKARATAILLILTLLITPTIASATSPHFVNVSVVLDPGYQVAVNFKEAGLGNSVWVTIKAEVTGTAIWGCVNNGGHHPKATNKTSAPVSATGEGTFESGKNGSVVGTLTLSPALYPPVGFDCPPGQDTTLLTLALSGTIFDMTNGVSAPVPSAYWVLWP